MDHRLIQHQSQKLILSPQIRQYLKLLQMPVTELEQAIDSELSENPLLEEKTPDSTAETLDKVSEDKVAEGPILSNTREVRVGETFDNVGDLDDSFQGHYSARDYGQEETYDSEAKKKYQESLITTPPQLTDYLLWQMRFLDLTDEQKKISDLILGNLDDDGFLRLSIEEIATTSGANETQAETVLKMVQQLDPPGIAAQNLQAALRIQIERKIADAEALNKNNPDPENKTRKTLLLARSIIQDHLPLLEKRNLQGIARVTNAGHEEIKKAVAEIGRLEPRPGRTFQSDESLAVTPDAAVYFSDDEDEEQKLKIDIPDERIPELRISHYYRKLLRSPQTDEKTRQFLKEKMQAATDFIRAVSLRKSTLRGITEEIVKAQTEFFEKGFAYLKPLRLKDIASALQVHESTVSRAIHSKYLYTPQGTIPYKSFFSTKLETTDGAEESQKSIMEKIKKIISLEDPKKPLSDQDIVGILTQDGIVIARRTVAKYRELLKILPTHLRREK